MDDIKFKSLEDLYKRILPALKTKTREIHKMGLIYIHEEDIWNYLKTYKWVSSRDLDLGGMVNDIMGLDITELKKDVEEKIKQYHREINQEEI